MLNIYFIYIQDFIILSTSVVFAVPEHWDNDSVSTYIRPVYIGAVTRICVTDKTSLQMLQNCHAEY